MTEQERDRLRELKQLVSERLSGFRPLVRTEFAFAMQNTDRRIGRYVLGVIDHPEQHNVWEQTAVLRCFRMLREHRYSRGRVIQFVRFAEAVRTSGQSGRGRLRLTPVQCFFAMMLYGFRSDDGRRLTTMAYLFIPRKFGKTTFAAVLAVFDMLCGDFNAEAYVAANSHDQAKICFREIRNILRCFDPSERVFKINREEVRFRNEKIRESSARCLTANARTKDGLFASLAIIDEYAQARNTLSANGADLKKVLMSSMGPRKEPLTVVITTASEVIDGPFTDELKAVKAILENELRPNGQSNDRMQALLFCPDADDAEDDPNTWAKVQPHLGITVQRDYYEREYKTALMSADYMTEFRTKQLNIFCLNEQKQWITPDKARSLLSDFDIMQQGAHMPTAVAFDLSVHDDFSAVSYTCYHTGQRKFYCHTDYYFPEGALFTHPNRQLYEAWHEQGYLHFCKGDCIDVRQIAEDIRQRSRQLKIVQIGYDSYKAQDLTNILMTFQGGRNMLTPYKQTYGAFNLPVESFEMLIYADPPRIVFNDNPINAYCMVNCVIDSDNLENKKPLKASQNQKIDGTITCLMTIGLLNTYKHG